MKKLITLFLALALTLSLVSCSGNKGVNNSVNEGEKISDTSAYVSQIHNNYIYYRNKDDGNALYRSRVSGDEVLRISERSAYLRDIKDGWIYYDEWATDENNLSTLYRLSLDGEKREKIIGNLIWIENLVVTDNMLYFAHNDIYRSYSDSPNRKPNGLYFIDMININNLYENYEVVEGYVDLIDADNKYVYYSFFTGEQTKTIQRLNLSNFEVDNLWSGSNSDVAYEYTQVDDKAIYAYGIGDEGIGTYRIYKDGSGATKFTEKRVTGIVSQNNTIIINDTLIVGLIFSDGKGSAYSFAYNSSTDEWTEVKLDQIPQSGSSSTSYKFGQYHLYYIKNDNLYRTHAYNREDDEQIIGVKINSYCIDGDYVYYSTDNGIYKIKVYQ